MLLICLCKQLYNFAMMYMCAYISVQGVLNKTEKDHLVLDYIQWLSHFNPCSEWPWSNGKSI